MFNIQTQLFEEKDVRFGSIDHETHPEIESKWTHDAEFMRLMELKPVCPLSPAMVMKQYEAIEKGMEEEKNLFYFTIRAREDDRLIGKALVEWIDWENGNGFIRLGIGSAEETQRLRLASADDAAALFLWRIEPVSRHCGCASLQHRCASSLSEIRIYGRSSQRQSHVP